MLLIDGQPGAAEWANDRGLAYGDGVFETIALWQSELLNFAAHLARLRDGCERLGFTAPDAALLERECRLAADGQTSGVLKVIVTRGSGGRGYRPPSMPQVRRLIMLHPWPALAQATCGVTTWLCAHRLSLNRGTAGIKHLNRLDQVMASREWPGEDYFEGLMQDTAGHLVEGTRSNLFMVREGSLHTPRLDDCGVRGVVREAVLAWARRHGVPVHERTMSVENLARADELFITNSIIGVRAVAAVRGALNVDYRPGPFSSTLARALRRKRAIP